MTENCIFLIALLFILYHTQLIVTGVLINNIWD